MKFGNCLKLEFCLKTSSPLYQNCFRTPQKKDQKSLRSRKRGRFKEHKIGSKINWQGDREKGPIMFRSKDYAHIIKFL